MLLAKYTFDARKQSYRFRAGPEAGHGKVLSMILRKDPNPAPRPRDPEDFIVYGTSRLEAFPSGVHIFNTNCELIHSFDCTTYSDPLALVKLKDGSFAVKLFDSVSILKKRSNFRNYKSRLFVGEADFSFTKALVKKHKGNHPDLPRAIVATELSPEADKCRKELKFEGVETHIGIDAQELHNHAKRFKRIHWNCPYREDLTDRNFDFPRVFRNFFESCSKIQRPGDRVHVTLMQERRDDRWKKFRQQECPVVSGSAYAGYRLVRKRIFGEGRYPGYGHWKSGGKSMHSAKDEDMREFVFEKVDFGVEYPAGKRHAVKKYRPSDTEYYFECSTDCDSSSYEDSSSEEDTDAKVGDV
ncbi:unnamed protein product [Bemisia tabaci]|uniref:25S rRNA (uridine-N(3))-methyltransferase BMT5-like domain-containing protein n=1 Tax=Bemisia tabaci TaxID=7038 RepID=A0A9P0AID4_BEMTA|nr:unnamed protein product [Bemisia tabaci]